VTVTAETSSISYTGNGATVAFSFPYRFLENEHLRVTRTVISTGAQTELTLDSGGADGFTASGAGEPAGGTITVVTAPTAAQRISIDLGNVPATQEQAYVPNTTLPAQTVERALDKLTMLVQNIMSGIGITRVLKLIVGDTDGSGRYDANGNRIVSLADGVSDDDAATVGQISAASGTYIAAGVGAVARTVQAALRERVLSVKDFGAVGNGVADDTAAIVLALAAAADQGCRLYFPDGTYMVSMIDETYTANLAIEMAPGAIIKGSVSYQHYAGTGATMVATITDFDFYAAGINVVINDGAAQTPLTEGVDYTRVGNVVTTSGAGGIVPIGQELQISSSESILTLRASPVGVDADSPTFSLRGGMFDSSDRGYAQSLPSGTALNIKNWRAPQVEGVTFYSGDSWETTVGTGLGGDSGLTLVQCVGGNVTGCFFQGLADLGIYNTGGNNDGVATDDGGALFVSGNTFYRCSTGVKSIRQSRAAMIVGNEFYECMTGILGGAVSGPIGAGYDHVIVGNVFKRMARRCVDLREMPSGATITGNRFIDWGRLPDGTVSSFGLTQAAVAVTGCPRTLVADNHFEFRDWSGVDFIGVRVNTSSVVVITPTAVTVRGNTFIGVEQGIVESGGSQVGCRYVENRMIDVTTPVTIEAADSVWHYINEDGTEVGGVGNVAGGAPDGTYTPTLTNTTNVAASTAYACQYARVGRTVTVSGKVDITCTASSAVTELRISLPIAAVFTAEEQAGGTANPGDVTGAGASGGGIRALSSGAANVVRLRYMAGSAATASRTWAFHFTYRIP
jgi:hypothetical protein